MLGLEADLVVVFFFQAEDGIRYATVTGVQTCALPISGSRVVARTRPGESDDEGVPDRLRRQGQPRAVLLGQLRPCRGAVLGPAGAGPSRRGAKLRGLGVGGGLLTRGQQHRLVAVERPARPRVLCIYLPRARRIPVRPGRSGGGVLRRAIG